MQKTPEQPTAASVLTHPIAITLSFVVCVCSAFGGQTALTVFFGFITLLCLCSFLWGNAALKQVSYTLDAPAGGVFPGQTVSLVRKLHNGKLLPLVWLELLEPCNPKGCLVPDEEFIVPNPRAEAEEPPENRHRAMYTFAMLGWHQTLTFTDEWRAVRRGIHRVDEVVLRSGDGFGLCARDRTLRVLPARTLAVYPRLVEVSVDRVLNDMWESRSASRGYLEDVTLLRSVRDYLPSDPARRINQRLLARGQGLMVNQYEEVTPSDVLFILDSASFAGEPAGEFEASLSILASLIEGLTRRNIPVGLAAPQSGYYAETFLAPSHGEGELARKLKLLAAARTGSPPLNGQIPLAPELVGQAYYIAYSVARATSLGLLAPFSMHKAKILACRTEQSTADARLFPVCPIQQFRRVS